MSRLRSILFRLISIPSYRDDEDNVNEVEVGNYVYNFFRELKGKDPDLEVEKQPVEGDRFNIIVKKGKPELLLGFHLDTVPTNERDWKVCHPFEPKEANGRVYGLGSVDVKGAIAAVMALSEEHLPKLNNFCYLFTVDEEYEFKGINKFLESNEIRPSLAVFGEPTNLKICNKHRGIIQARVTAYGKSAHAGSPNLGINAIELLMDSVGGVKKTITSEEFEDPELGRCSFNLAYIRGGKEGSYNRVPDEAMVVLDIRTTPKLTVERVKSLVRNEIKEKFKQRCEENGLDFVSTFREPEMKVDFVYGPLLTSRESLKKLESIVKREVGEVGYIMSQGITEAGILSERWGVPACNFGPGPMEMSHKPDEFVNLKDLELVKRVYTELLKEYSKVEQDAGGGI
ncbi:hypothetical protein DRN62_01515 [Nanoarchaeota archaeon]|nr:MAG: hypothetical protein DRN62_01515 [Nanoarchaeota archaeon]